MLSLQARLGTGLLVSLILVFLVLWLLVSNTIRYLVEDYIASRLEHDGESLLTAVTFDRQDTPILDSARTDSAYRRPFSGHYFKITSGENVLRSRSLWDQDLVVPALQAGAGIRLRLTGPERQPLLVMVKGYSKQDHTLTIAVGEDLSSVEAAIASFETRFTGTALLMLLVLIVLQAVIVRTGLRPLERVRREIRALEHAELRGLSADVPREVAPLVLEINRLLEVLNRRLQRSRHALGDLTHALKKPLTRLRQLSHDNALAKQPAVQQTLDDQTRIMQQLTDRVLRRARLAGQGPVGVLFSVAQEVPVLIETLRSMYRQKSLRFDIDFQEGLTLPFDREDMLELLGNVLDNACKWARGCVSLTMRMNTKVCIVIADDGPGVDEESLAKLTRRGVRLDGSVAGHGLGLAITRDIIEDYRGSLTFGRSEALGGLSVTLSIPVNPMS